MDLKYLLTSFDGRIGRKQFWIGILCIIVAAFILIFVLGITLGLFLPFAFVSLIGSLILLYPSAALMAKRLHDRNKGNNPWLYIFIGPSLVLTILSGLGIGFETVTIEGSETSYPSNMITILLTIVSTVVGLWALVELGFLKGTAGSNDYGEDPTT